MEAVPDRRREHRMGCHRAQTTSGALRADDERTLVRRRRAAAGGIASEPWAGIRELTVRRVCGPSYQRSQPDELSGASCGLPVLEPGTGFATSLRVTNPTQEVRFLTIRR